MLHTETDYSIIRFNISDQENKLQKNIRLNKKLFCSHQKMMRNSSKSRDQQRRLEKKLILENY